MSDFDEGLAVGLAIGRKKFSGSMSDPIFHDIIDNSETIMTVPVDDTYTFTLNFWVSGTKYHHKAGYQAVTV